MSWTPTLGTPHPRAQGRPGALLVTAQAEKRSTRNLDPVLFPTAHQDQPRSGQSLLPDPCCEAKGISPTCPQFQTLPGLPLTLGIMSKLPTSMESSSRQLGAQPDSLPSSAARPHPRLWCSPPLISAHAFPVWNSLLLGLCSPATLLPPPHNAAQALPWAAFPTALPCPALGSQVASSPPPEVSELQQ